MGHRDQEDIALSIKQRKQPRKKNDVFEVGVNGTFGEVCSAHAVVQYSILNMTEQSNENVVSYQHITTLGIRNECRSHCKFGLEVIFVKKGIF